MIVIHESKVADSRTCDPSTVSRDQLFAVSQQHIDDVSRGLMFFATAVGLAAAHHDRDKLSDIDGFYANFLTGFAERDWLERHYTKNRHHLDQPTGVPADVNLIDVLDFVADQVMAGMGRSGKVRPIALPPKLLELALQNTVALLAKNVEVRRSAP